jgi:hypothetical protein
MEPGNLLPSSGAIVDQWRRFGGALSRPNPGRCITALLAHHLCAESLLRPWGPWGPKILPPAVSPVVVEGGMQHVKRGLTSGLQQLWARLLLI